MEAVSKLCPQTSQLSLWVDEFVWHYACRSCKKTFYNAKALQNHNNLYHSSSQSNSSDAESEDLNVHDNEDFSDVCGFKYIVDRKPDEQKVVARDDGTTSLRTHEEDTTYLFIKVACEYPETASRKRKSSAQDKTVDVSGPFICTFLSKTMESQCRKTFHNCCEYSMHYRQEHTKRKKSSMRCQVCEKPLGSLQKSEPVADINQIWSCGYCQLTFLDRTNHQEHVRNFHTKAKPYHCTLCPKRFTQNGGLIQHMRMHAGIRPFQCTFCPKAFTQKAGLEQHLRTHTKIKPFTCVVCTKAFSQAVHLKQHMRTHTNIQPFTCRACGKKFKQSSHLNFHMRCHGELENAQSPIIPNPIRNDSDLLNLCNVTNNQDDSDLFNFCNVTEVQDGETVYYSAELDLPFDYLNE